MLTRMWATLWSAALIVVLEVGTCAALPAQSGATPVSEPSSIDQAWPDVNLNVVVFDKQGAPQTVDEHQFRLVEDGAERPLRFRGSPDSPVSLALIIDSSGSILKRKQAIKDTVTTIVKSLPPGSEVTAVLFANWSFLDLPFTAVDKVDFSFLNRLDARGGTALFDAVDATERYFIAHARYVRRAMVILSDGKDNASQVSEAVAFHSMEQPGGPAVYLCPTSKVNLLKMQDSSGLINMHFLAKWGGGADFNLDPDPAAAAAKVVASIRSQVVLQFTASDPARDGKKRKLEIRLSDKDLKIRALPEYFAPAK